MRQRQTGQADKLGIYIHIPFCRSKCDYCDFYSLAGREDRMDAYQKALLAHIRGDCAPGPGHPGRHRLFRRGHPQLVRGPAHPGAALRPEQAFSGGEGRRDHGGGKP